MQNRNETVRVVAAAVPLEAMKRSAAAEPAMNGWRSPSSRPDARFMLAQRAAGEFDREPFLQRLCSSRSTYINGTLRAAGHGTLADAELPPAIKAAAAKVPCSTIILPDQEALAEFMGEGHRAAVVKRALIAWQEGILTLQKATTKVAWINQALRDAEYEPLTADEAAKL